jgi:hypothetical protein
MKIFFPLQNIFDLKNFSPSGGPYGAASPSASLGSAYGAPKSDRFFGGAARRRKKEEKKRREKKGKKKGL